MTSELDKAGLAAERHACARKGPCSDAGDGCTCSDDTLQQRLDKTTPAAPEPVAEAEGLEVVERQWRGTMNGPHDWCGWTKMGFNGPNPIYEQHQTRELVLKSAADARIAALQAEVERLTEERDEALDDAKFAERIATKREADAEADLATARQQIERLTDALRGVVTVRDRHAFDAARAALRESGE